MQPQKQNKKHKKFVFISLSIVFVVLMSGFFAWNSIHNNIQKSEADSTGIRLIKCSNKNFIVERGIRRKRAVTKEAITAFRLNPSSFRANDAACRYSTYDQALYTVVRSRSSKKVYKTTNKTAQLVSVQSVANSWKLGSLPSMKAPQIDGRNLHRLARVSGKLTCRNEGPRVEVLYVRHSNVPNRFGQYKSTFRSLAEKTHRVVFNSAKKYGVDMGVNWVRDSSCKIAVKEVIIPDLTDMNGVIHGLQVKGFNKADRRYLVFADTVGNTSNCGQGLNRNDDSPGQSNQNNTLTSWAVTWSDGNAGPGCWTISNGRVPTHELFHTLGAVQDSAPNSSGEGHCKEGYDIICPGGYAESFGGTVKCKTPGHTKSSDPYNNLLDCNGNDYFNPKPKAGSYLATHWNTARSRFLYRAAYQ